MRLAESLTAIGQLDEAAELYKRVLAYHPDSAQSWYRLGRLQALARDHQAAVSSFSKACELYPNYGMEHFAFGSELRRLGRNTEAEQQLAIYLANMTVQPPVEDELMAQVQYLNKSAQTCLKRAAELADFFNGIWLDLDGKDFGEANQTLADQFQLMLDQLKRYCLSVGMPDPSAMVWSGGGIHAFWLCKQPIGKELWKRLSVALYNSAKEHRLAADLQCTTDAARVLRVACRRRSDRASRG